MKIKLFQLLLLTSAFNACASGFSQWGTIEQTYTSGSWTMVNVSGVDINPDNCEASHYYAINTSDPNYQAILSSLLAAQMAQKNVRFWLSGCGGQDGKYPKLTSSQLNS